MQKQTTRLQLTVLTRHLEIIKTLKEDYETSSQYIMRLLDTAQQEKTMEYKADYQTQTRGTNDQEYQIYLSCADDGKGGDITRNGEPLLSYDEWLNK